MLRENGGIQAPSHARLSQHGPLPRITLVEVRPGPPQSWGSQGCWKISLLENEVREHSTSGRCYSHKRSRRLSRAGASNQVSPLVDPFLQENWQRGDSIVGSSAALNPPRIAFQYHRQTRRIAQSPSGPRMGCIRESQRWLANYYAGRRTIQGMVSLGTKPFSIW